MSKLNNVQAICVTVAALAFLAMMVSTCAIQQQTTAEQNAALYQQRAALGAACIASGGLWKDNDCLQLCSRESQP